MAVGVSAENENWVQRGPLPRAPLRLRFQPGQPDMERVRGSSVLSDSAKGGGRRIHSAADVNAIRSMAGSSAAVWTSPSPLPSKVIKRVDLVELRDRLHEARTTLGLSSGAYTVDPSITVYVTTIKRQHVQELRERTR